ncbi:MAG: DUF4968 domain-containing protein [Balneolales bacterium]|nr:DUF4968 domain-containing protein [Balneolales bacterium]
MKKRLFKKSVFLFLLAISTFATGTLIAQHQSFERAEQHFLFHTEAGTWQLLFYTPEILEVNFFEEGKSAADYNVSHAVVLRPENVRVHVNEHNDLITLSTEGIHVKYDVRRGEFSYSFKDQHLLSAPDTITLNHSTNDDDDNEQTHSEGFRIDLRVSESEALMGGGSRALGMNRRGNRLELYNRAHYGYEERSDLINFTLPVVMSSRGYMLHFDNPTTGWLDLDSGNDHTLGFEAFSGRKTFQLIAGESWEHIIRNYTMVTGLQPLPPRWALGNFSSRFGYRTQQEALETIAAFREKQIPVDTIILDLYWFGSEMLGTMGNLAFYEPNWPDPQQMVRELEEMGVKTVLITEPFVLTTSNRWEEAVRANALATDSLGNPATWDFFFGHTGLIDVFHPDGKSWFWNIYKDLKNTYGIHGWWGDLGEPEVHPDWVQHHTGSAREVHNIYGHQWARMIHEGYRNNFPGKRYFNLMRAGYSGSQRFGMIPWTGDVSRNWGGLKPQPEIALQMGMQGFAYIHSDLGGFAWPNEDPELYVRWMQYGVFQPIYRPHAQDDVPSEPVFWDEDTINLSRKAIELRYRLMPYIYTAAFENSRSGLPIMRPLFFEEPDRFEYYHIAESYLFGSDFLVAPVLRQGERQVTVHAPSTANWFDFYSGAKLEGGRSHDVRTRRESIPVFVRGGAIIPKAELVQTLDDYHTASLELLYFHDPEAPEYQTFVYHDDGLSEDSYKDGRFEKLHIKRINTEDNATDIAFTVENGGSFDRSFSEIKFVLIHKDEMPVSITLDGEAVSFSRGTDGRVRLDTFTLSGDEHHLRIQF